MSCGFGCGASSSCAKGPYCSGCNAGILPIGPIPPFIDPLIPPIVEEPGLIDDVIIGTGMARGMARGLRREARREAAQLAVPLATQAALASRGFVSYPGPAPIAQAAIANRALAWARPWSALAAPGFNVLPRANWMW
jgi:hypothetical protein